MISNKHRDAGRFGSGNSRNTRYTVVDRDEQRRKTFGCDLNDFRAQPVTKLESIGHEVIDFCKTECAQAAEYERRTGRAINIKITNNGYALVALLTQ